MKSKFQQLPETLRMVLVAIAGALIGLATYNILYRLLPFQPRATICWAISFAIGIWRQHGLHRAFTFTHPSPYWQSLRRAYVMYSGSAVVGVALNFFLTKYLGVEHMIAWLCCLLVTATISFFFLKKRVFIPATAATISTTEIPAGH